jgi:hypothetical protein
MGGEEREENYRALVLAPMTAVRNALRDGDRGGKEPGSWRGETVEDQLKHIERHVTQYQCGDRNEDHLSHIVCRAAIAFALRSLSPPPLLHTGEDEGGGAKE